MEKLRFIVIFMIIIFASCTRNNQGVDDLHDTGTVGGQEPAVFENAGDVNSREGSIVGLSVTGQDNRIIVSEIVSKNGRTYVEHMGNPYLLYGVQIRLDTMYWGDRINLAPYEEYFKRTADLNFKTIEMQAWWSFIEYEKDRYDFFDIKAALEWCEKYDLYMQLIWFGSNVAGGPTDIPRYILDDRETYPRNPKAPDTHVKLDTPAFIEREAKAVQALMDFIRDHDLNHRIMMIQVEAEPDNVQGIPAINWGNEESVAEWMWAGGQAEESIVLLDQLGQVVKNSDRPMVTRVAVIDQSYLNPILRSREYLRRIFETPGIDIVGIDNYSGKLSDQIELMDYLEALIPDNIAHQPETGGHQANYISQTLLAFSRANGHLVYELRAGDWMPQELDCGIYRASSTEWVERDGTLEVDVYPSTNRGRMRESVTSEIRSFNKTIYKASNRIASLPKENIAVFNLQEWDQRMAPNRTLNQPCGIYTISCYSPEAKQGFAMSDVNNDLIMLGIGPITQYTIEGKTLSGDASVGYFTETGEWVEESKLQLSGNIVNVYENQCVKVEAVNIS